MKPKFNLLLILITFVLHEVQAQDETSSLKPNAIFFEMGGPAGSHSINYERRFNHNSLIDFSVRGGFGYDNFFDYKGDFNPDFAMPFTAGVMYGKNHKVELNLGETFASTIVTNTTTGDPNREASFNTTFYLGYRYQNPQKNILLRAGYAPYLEFNEQFKHWIGVSVGYIF